MKTEVLSTTDEDLDRAARAIQEEELVALPTETVYGLAARADSEKAVDAIFEAKERPSNDPLIVHIADAILEGQSWMQRLSPWVNLDGYRAQPLKKLLDHFWPGPLTVVLPKSSSVSLNVTAGLSTVALRMPAHPIVRSIIERSGHALAAPSANRFAKVSPTRAEHVLSDLKDRIPLIIDGGPTKIGLESTVVEVRGDGEIRYLRPGIITRNQIRDLLGVEIKSGFSQGGSPGLMRKHYSPRKPFYPLPGSLEETPKEFLEKHSRDSKIGVLLSGIDQESHDFPTRALPYSEDPQRAIRKLYESLRELDDSEADVLFWEPIPVNHPYSEALLDRLSKASTHS